MITTLRASCAAGALAAAGCAASIPLPQEGERGAEDPIIVSDPPPVPKVEVVHPAPENLQDPVWVSGQWLYRGRRWEWQEGRWETPPHGGKYLRPQIVYLEDRTIGWFPGRWSAPPPR